MKFDDLDLRQKQVVDAVLKSDGKILVLGGPGSGKTTTALWTARTFLETSDRNLARVLFLTFSRSAVSQITSRSPGVVSGYSDQIEIVTFHGLAYRLLEGFGRYSGHGTTSLSIQSETRVKLLGHDSSKLRYKDLIPGVIEILEGSERINKLLTSRWGLVICDEVQDTNAEQLQLLEMLASRKLLLLGDGNQMIYTFIPGVSPERFQQIRAWADTEIELLPTSHRDPSGAIPALANAIRQRRFDDEAVVDAVDSGRLAIHFDSDPDDCAALIGELISDARNQGSRNVGIFAHSNAAVADLANQLNEAGIDHVLVGIPEAHAEALASMATQCAYASGLATDEDVCLSMALFLTSVVRGTATPELARALIGGQALPGLVEQNLNELKTALTVGNDGIIDDVTNIAMQSWAGLGIKAGYRPWHRAAAHFRRLTAPLRQLPVSEEAVCQLLEIIERSRIESLINLDYAESGPVMLMTYHQTKGREADTVIHVFRQDDYFGRAGEPFEEASRLLNVAISRARQRVVIVMPSSPHPLIAPFASIEGT